MSGTVMLAMSIFDMIGSIQSMKFAGKDVFIDSMVGMHLRGGCTIDTSDGEVFVHHLHSGSSLINTTNASDTIERWEKDGCIIESHVYPVHGRYLRGAYECLDSYARYQSYLDTTRVRSAWTHSNGASAVHIMIVDDGVGNHYDLPIFRRFDVSAHVHASHGTSVAGVAAGRNNNRGICGMAPEARIVDINLLATNFISDATEALAFDNDHMSWTGVYCNSWGPTDDGRNEGPGAELLGVMNHSITHGRNGRGSIYVFAAGNGGPNENMNDDGYANHPYTIAVSALNENSVAYFCEWGAAISVTASGYQLLATGNDDSFMYFYGTSASAPIVAGTVANMLAVNEQLGWRDVQEILQLSARVQYLGGSDGWLTNAAGRRYHYAYGSGRVDAERAVNIARHWPTMLHNPRHVTKRSVASTALPSIVAWHVPDDIRVEHVRVCVRILADGISISDGGGIGAWIESPEGTRAYLTRPTDRVSVIAGCSYHNWCFTSLVQWGEHSRGVWTFYAEHATHVPHTIHETRLELSGDERPYALYGCR